MATSKGTGPGKGSGQARGKGSGKGTGKSKAPAKGIARTPAEPLEGAAPGPGTLTPGTGASNETGGGTPPAEDSGRLSGIHETEIRFQNGSISFETLDGFIEFRVGLKGLDDWQLQALNTFLDRVPGEFKVIAIAKSPIKKPPKSS